MGSDGNEETWRSCVTDTNNVMGFAVGAMFVRQSFRGESKPLAESMIAAVKEAFKNNFENLDWMDEETRSAARDKANAITDMIGKLTFSRIMYSISGKASAAEMQGYLSDKCILIYN